MSARNRLDNKRSRRMIRALRKGSTPAYIDLISWLQEHGHASTGGAAKRLITEHRVKADTHVLGYRTVEDEILNEESGKLEKQDRVVYDPHVPVSTRGRIEVLAEDAVASAA